MKRQLDLPIDSRATVLLGPNDHGKSNLLRALTHLRVDTPITSGDRNWDLPPSKEPQVEYHLDLLEVDRKRINELVGTGTKTTVTAVPRSVVAHRSGETGLEIRGVTDPSVGTAILSMLPKVEVFEPLGSIPDSVTASTIANPTHEFMKGIFMYAGLRPAEWTGLFAQDDQTLKRLERASKKLNQTIRKDWSQGQGLEFELRHDSASMSISMHLKDPSVSSRWVRASEKSSGFAHYFSLRTRMFARSGGEPDGSYLWLFDEPGVWLHPAGQFDLLQAIEAIAQRNQVVYSTHSVFMINRNFPARHRLIVKSPRGTQLDVKPYASRWSAAVDALGLSLGGSLLFAPCVLLTEGDSDPVLIYATLQRLASRGLFDKDINSLAILATGDIRNGEAIARLLLQGAHKPRIAVLVDGDGGGRDRGRPRRGSSSEVAVLALPGSRETEDFIPDPVSYVASVATVAGNASGGDAEVILAAVLAAYASEKPARMLGKWAADKAKEVASLDSPPSKLVAATLWTERLVANEDPNLDLRTAEELARIIDEALDLPRRTSEEHQIS